jgi:aminoglycoside phosphotransferase (APT) family kinase protein
VRAGFFRQLPDNAFQPPLHKTRHSMPIKKMHAGEVDTGEDVARRLLEAQFPQWAALPIQPVASAGTDNTLYRLGEDLVMRLPRIHWAAGQAEKEVRWLPALAPHLPLAIPVPLALGAPGEGYPFGWSICPWFEGENATLNRIANPLQAAADLARFVTALQRIDAEGGPPPGQDNSFRGVPLADRDAHTRAAIAEVRDLFDARALTAAWEAALHAPVWHGPPAWIHGDLQSGNLLARQGRLSAVIDFGCLGVGDPACDLMVAWNLLPSAARETFRAALAVDEAAWARGRGWALSVGLIALPYYRRSNPTLAGIARYAIEQVLGERDG